MFARKLWQQWPSHLASRSTVLSLDGSPTCLHSMSCAICTWSDGAVLGSDPRSGFNRLCVAAAGSLPTRPSSLQWGVLSCQQMHCHVWQWQRPSRHCSPQPEAWRGQVWNTLLVGVGLPAEVLGYHRLHMQSLPVLQEPVWSRSSLLLQVSPPQSTPACTLRIEITRLAVSITVRVHL